MKIALFSFIFLGVINVQAQRLPDSLSRGLYVSNEGFEINPQKTSWIKSAAPDDLKNKVEALFRIKDQKSSSTFTIRVDKDTPYKTLKEYSHKWLKNYGQFGLEVLGSQYFKTKNDDDGFVVDISNTSSQKKLRQVIFFRNSKAVILTCMDQETAFKDTLKACNDLIKTFSWQQGTLANPESTIQ